MKNILDYINSQTNNAYQYVKLVGVVYDEKTGKTTFKFIYQNDKTFKQSDKELFFNLINEYYQNTLAIDVKVKRDYVDEEVVADYVYKYIQTIASIKNDIKKDSISVKLNDVIAIDIKVNKPMCDYLQSRNFANELAKYMGEITFEEYEVSLTEVKLSEKYENALNTNQEIALQLNDVPTVSQSIKLQNLIKVFGEELEHNALDLSTIKGAMQKCQIAGRVRYFSPKTFQSKRPDKNGNYPIKTFYTWSLNYASNTMHCVYFPLKSNGENEFALADDMQVVVGGDVEEYMSKLNFKVKSLSTCDIVETTTNVVGKKVNDNYLFVQPQKVENVAQYNFFEIKAEPNAFLANNEIVVFDTETTGLDYKTNEIIEIGAVKLHNGEIVESFSTFVKPIAKIPSEITRLTGINDSMVANAYSINQVIPDFYKFCYGCVLVGYNIDFDYKFINTAGTKIGYKFDNRQVDAMYLARKEVKGAKNFTLSSICKRLGVSLEGAHRAINDARATAEVLKLISDNVSPN